MPAPSLILIKHSLPHIDPHVPARRWQLSDTGRQRAARLANLLVAHQPGLLYTSTEDKAMQTAAIIGQRLGLAPRPADGLHEHQRQTAPVYERQVFTGLIERLFACPDQVVFGEESARQAGERFAAATAAICARHPHETVAIVAHGTVISLYAAQQTVASPQDSYQLWQRLGLPAFIVLQDRRITAAYWGEENASGAPPPTPKEH